MKIYGRAKREAVYELTPIKTSTDAPMYVDPTWHALLLLHTWSGGKTARLHQVTSRYGPHRKAARTRSSQYGRTPPPAGWGSA